MASEGESTIVATFDDMASFQGALEALVRAGFARSEISVLGDHQAILDHFGHIPDVEELAGRMDTPRDSLAEAQTLRDVIGFISETIAVVAEIGTAAAAYAVGGPVGTATGAAAASESTVSELLSAYTDDAWKDRVEESLRDGGLVCWVHARGPEEARSATAVLKDAGAGNVHATDALPPNLLPRD